MAIAALKGQVQALDALGRRPEALTLLADCVKGHPDNGDIWLTAAELAAQRQEDYGLAVSYYQRLYQMKPDPQVRQRLLALLTSLNRLRALSGDAHVRALAAQQCAAVRAGAPRPGKRRRGCCAVIGVQLIEMPGTFEAAAAGNLIGTGFHLIRHRD